MRLFLQRLLLPLLAGGVVHSSSTRCCVDAFVIPLHPSSSSSSSSSFTKKHHSVYSSRKGTTKDMRSSGLYGSSIYTSTSAQEDDVYYSKTSSSSSSSSPSMELNQSGVGEEKIGAGTQRITLTRYLKGYVQDNPELRDMESLLLSVQMACKTISNLVHRAGINHLSSPITTSLSPQDQYDIRLNSMKKLDQLSTTVLQHALHFTGKLQMVTPAKSQRQRDKRADSHVVDDVLLKKAENSSGGSSKEQKNDDKPDSHQPGVLIAKAYEGRYVACFDPLDGSGNADAAICTGTVFGIFETDDDDDDDDDDDKDDKEDIVLKKEEMKKTKETNSNDQEDDDDDDDDDDGIKTREELVEAVLQPGKNLRAAGYCLYSSATILVLSLGDGKTHGFTLDPQINEFVLTHWNMRIPSRGNVYSCNEANSEGWSDKGWKEYLSKLKKGEGETGEKYALRYVGSMVGDIHRTLMYGGIFAYPSDTDQHPRGNLQLLYKCAPMGYIVSQAGGLCTNGEKNLLDVRPNRVHERSPCFMGSPEDMQEMMKYVKHEEEKQ